jgi:acyl-CoA dehydrogenase
LEAGTSWWEKELFMGAPDWQKFDQYPYPKLSVEEQSFVDNEVQQLCAMLDEWKIHHKDKNLPPEVWQFIKDKGFLGLIIPKSFGGKEFSAFAQSRIMSKIASRSLTAAVSCMVPNSLGPGELLLHYGTTAQKQRYLPGLANGTEIPCFGLTSPEAGSDAGAIPDTGIVCYGSYQGQEVLGLKMNFSKRWITLAPIATVIGLAFKLYDPDGLLGDKSKSEYGITCALIPASHEGIKIGARHNPGAPFMNGTVEGTDIFIPIDWIIGGQQNAGKGWRMLMECLGVGRGISLPALATAAGEMSYLLVGAFASVRQQFKVSVGHFEGVQEATSDIASDAYMLESFRYMVTCGLNQGGTPAVMTAMAKYYATETMRKVINHGMDVVGGRAIQLGPRNFLALTYQSIPVAITVEGANILTRSLMIFGQGSMRCHPYLFEELQLLQSDDKASALKNSIPCYLNILLILLIVLLKRLHLVSQGAVKRALQQLMISQNHIMQLSIG